MMTRKAVIFWFAAAVIVGLIVYSVLARVIENRRMGSGEQRAVSVITSPLERGRIEELLSYSGTLEPLYRVTITSKVAATIEELFVREGQLVQRDDILLKIDDDAVRLQRQQAYAALQAALAQAEKARAKLDIEQAQRPLIPDLSLNLGFDITGQKIPGIDEDWVDTWDLNFTVSLGGRATLLDFGRSRSRINQAKEQVEIARWGVVQLQDLLSLKVREGVQEARIAFYSLAENRERLILAEERDKNARASYDNELINREQLGGARIELLTRQLGALRVRFALEMALNELEYLSGGEL